jgi:hypothetical protein
MTGCPQSLHVPSNATIGLRRSFSAVIGSFSVGMAVASNSLSRFRSAKLPEAKPVRFANNSGSRFETYKLA